jgi:hypothetical protein
MPAPPAEMIRYPPFPFPGGSFPPRVTDGSPEKPLRVARRLEVPVVVRRRWCHRCCNCQVHVLQFVDARGREVQRLWGSRSESSLS